MSAAEQDRRWMRVALREARRGLGLTSPNPPVGAAIVSRGGELLATGWHRKAGAAHAEVEALSRIALAHKSRLKSATLYVTLEPCSTHGKTPPCTEALCAAGVRRVVWAMNDPNPLHAGRAAAVLRRAGIATTAGVCEDEAAWLLQPWKKFITTGVPWLIAKAGMSLDGRITRPAGEGQWLTSEASRHDAMSLRRTVDAILVGAETVRRDNPRLTLRGIRLPREKMQPWRVILTRSGVLPQSCHLLTDEFKGRTLTFRKKSLDAVLRDLAARGVVIALLEGGASLLAQAFAAGLVDEFHAYIAPLISGSGLPAIDAAAFGAGPSIPLELAECRRIGGDVKLICRRP